VLPLVGFVDGGAPDVSAPRPTAFRKGLNEAGYFENLEVAEETHRYEMCRKFIQDKKRTFLP
jgi:hypothetical protein